MSKIQNGPRWKALLERALSKYPDQTGEFSAQRPQKSTLNPLSPTYLEHTVIQLATIASDSQRTLPKVRSHIFRSFLQVDSGTSGTFPPPHLPLLITSTDLRTPKVSQIKANSNIEFAWWIKGDSDDDKTRMQFRISGKAFLIPSPNGPSQDLYSEFEKTVQESFKLPRSEAQGYLGLQSLWDAYQQSSPKEFWESHRQAAFRSLSAHMKASWCKPPPGTPLALYGGPEAAKKWPVRVEEPDDSDSPEEREKKQKNWDQALGNFVLVVIEPVEVDFVDLGVQPNKRFRFWRDEKGVWGEQELVP